MQQCLAAGSVAVDNEEERSDHVSMVTVALVTNKAPCLHYDISLKQRARYLK